MKMLYLVSIATLVVSIKALTWPLPDAESKLSQEVIKCDKGKEFLWDRTEEVGNDMKLIYRCGDKNAEEETRMFTCKQGYKAHSKRQSICNPGPDANFGFFREGKDPNVMDTVRIVYFCMKDSKNTLPKC